MPRQKKIRRAPLSEGRSVPDTSQNVAGDIPVDGLSFLLFEGATPQALKSLSAPTRQLLAATGTGVPGTKGGSFALLTTKDGREYMGWIDEKGAPQAALAVKTIERGVGNTINFEAERYPGGTLFRRHGAALKLLAGQVDAVTTDGAEDGTEIDVYKGVALLPAEIRLLGYLGVGIAGRACRVKTTHDGRAIEAQLSNTGKLSVSKSKFWEAR